MKLFTLFISACSLCAHALFSETPQHDGRFQRGEYVSSFLKPGDVGAEIGVQMGTFAYYVLLPKKPSKLYLIDPWQFGVQGYGDQNGPLGTASRTNEYDYVCKLFQPYPNVKILKMKSNEAVTLFTNASLDYVYIDGEHSYKAVLTDLTNYFPKIKVGGYLIGDDYGWTGVGKAVQDFLYAHQKECLFFDPYAAGTGGQYVIRKVQ